MQTLVQRILAYQFTIFLYTVTLFNQVNFQPVFNSNLAQNWWNTLTLYAEYAYLSNKLNEDSNLQFLIYNRPTFLDIISYTARFESILHFYCTV